MEVKTCPISEYLVMQQEQKELEKANQQKE